PGASRGSSCSRSSASRSASAGHSGRTTCTTSTTRCSRRSSSPSRCWWCAGAAAAARRCRTPKRLSGPQLRLREAVALGLLHGPAELLPVSSSGHVTLVPWLAGWDYPDLDAELRKAFEVALHAGTAAALLLALRAEVGDAARGFDR